MATADATVKVELLPEDVEDLIHNNLALGDRVLFLECAVTVLANELVARGILPRAGGVDALIADAESLMGSGERTKGRGELVAAFIHGNGNGTDDDGE